jgi:hypothetical protein
MYSTWILSSLNFVQNRFKSHGSGKKTWCVSRSLAVRRLARAQEMPAHLECSLMDQAPSAMSPSRSASFKAWEGRPAGTIAVRGLAGLWRRF